jgi:hypothetical protein
MNTQREFPDLIKAGLKVGDRVYSYLHGDGRVNVIDDDDDYPITAYFPIYDDHKSFTKRGFEHITDLMPSITLTPWNPIAGEPFPFPKFEPVVGQVYAFWDEVEGEFRVSKFTGIGEAHFIDQTYTAWKHCAPIAEAMHFFGFDKPQQP